MTMAWVLAVVVLALWTSMPEAADRPCFSVSDSGAADILLTRGGQSPDSAALTNWDPHELLAEIRDAAMEDAVRRVLEQQAANLPPGEAEQLARMLTDEGRREGIDPLFLAALIRVESAFSNQAISNKGARGLMQVMPATGREMALSLGLEWSGAEQLHDPATNVRLGTGYLGRLLELYRGNYRLAVTAYNRGPRGVRFLVQRDGGLGTEYTEYFRKVQETYRAYLRSLGTTGVVLRAFG
ncbi:MAG TPA: lytic transglycosylase domain-containing protein [Myxococcota bacterium]|nr:lytic transglycosylase domain-containing protein [Myxococcota bacterium]HRY95099.1 lytic transglycosylase domain-containing protein [Myxococcota bacterium]HSA23265.1 lytic transglycosylase domain-containing protein [Myxococcota bacterium]